MPCPLPVLELELQRVQGARGDKENMKGADGVQGGGT
jgi:hypothetical protein